MTRTPLSEVTNRHRTSLANDNVAGICKSQLSSVRPDTRNSDHRSHVSTTNSNAWIPAFDGSGLINAVEQAVWSTVRLFMDSAHPDIPHQHAIYFDPAVLIPKELLRDILEDRIATVYASICIKEGFYKPEFICEDVRLQGVPAEEFSMGSIMKDLTGIDDNSGDIDNLAPSPIGNDINNFMDDFDIHVDEDFESETGVSPKSPAATRNDGSLATRRRDRAVSDEVSPDETATSQDSFAPRRKNAYDRFAKVPESRNIRERIYEDIRDMRHQFTIGRHTYTFDLSSDLMGENASDRKGRAAPQGEFRGRRTNRTSKRQSENTIRKNMLLDKQDDIQRAINYIFYGTAWHLSYLPAIPTHRLADFLKRFSEEMLSVKSHIQYVESTFTRDSALRYEYNANGRIRFDRRYFKPNGNTTEDEERSEPESESDNHILPRQKRVRNVSKERPSKRRRMASDSENDSPTESSADDESDE